MTNLKIGKILNKTIILIVTWALLCSVSVSAAVTLDADVTKDDATLTVSCGDAFAGKNVVVQVFEPTASVEDLLGDGNYNEDDADIIKGSLVCVYHGKLNANGEVSFTVAPTGPKGVYGVRISVKSIYEPIDTEFVFSTDYDAQQIIDKLMLKLDAASVADALKKDTEANDRVYQPYQILKVAESKYYNEYDKLGDVKASVHSNIAANFKTAGVEAPSDFVTLFEEAVAVETVNVKTGDDLKNYIEKNADILGLSARNEYNNVYSNPKRFTEDNKTALIATMEAAPLTGKTPKDVADKFCEEILVNILPAKEEAPGVVDSFILEFDTTLETNGADMTAYKALKKPLDICGDIVAFAPFATIKDFADAINASLPKDGEEEETITPSKPTGDTTGVKSEGTGGGGGGTSYTPKDEVVEEPKADETETVFNDVADSHWAYEAVTELYAQGIVSGKGNGNFAPNDMVKREEFVKMLSGILSLTDDGGENPAFSDVTGSEWFAPYVYAAYKNGIVNGVGDAFGVGQSITREDMAVLCARAIDFEGVTLDAVRDGMSFTDSISAYAQDAVEKLWNAGLVNGKSETEFAPKATATRAEAAKMLYEVLKAIR